MRAPDPRQPSDDASRSGDDELRAILDTVQDVVYRVDATDQVVVASRSALRMLGYDRLGEILGQPAARFWADPAERGAMVEALRRHGQVVDWPVRLKRRDGSVLDAATTARRVVDADGRVDGYVGVFRDVGERRRAEEVLRHSEEKFSKVFLTSPDTITVSRASDGLLLDVNPGFERATGWSRAEAVGRTTAELQLWGEPRARAELVAALAAGEEVVHREMVFRRRGGELREGVASARTIVVAGEPCIIFQLQDVTDQRRAEAALRLSEERRKLAVEGADLGTWDYEITTGRVAFDAGWAGMLGYGVDELPGRIETWEHRLHPDDRPAVLATLAEHITGRSPFYEAEYRLAHRDGHWVWILSRGRAIERDAAGQAVRMAGTHLDLSDHKRLEAERLAMELQLRQAQKLEAIGQVAGGVAHDFNNLLTVQLGNLELLREVRGLPPEAVELIEDVERSARGAAELTRQLLAFGRRQVMQRRPVELNEVLGGFLRMLRRVVREDVRLEFRGGDRPLRFEADVGMLEQVVMNLAVNARDAMPKGGRLAIEADEVVLTEPPPDRPRVAPGRYVRLTVSDTGHGMDEPTRSRIFEPFFTTKPAGQGSGLGLATVYGIVRQHGGFIEVRSQVGVGTTFEVYWPAGPVAEPAPCAPPPVGLPTGRGELVLLVEDEPAVRSSVRAMLLRLGYRVLEARDAAVAVAAWGGARGGVQLLLSDVVMPGPSGVELALRLVRAQPGLPVVLMSGYSADLAEGGLPAEATFLQKPCGLEAVARAVRAALERPRGEGPVSAG